MQALFSAFRQKNSFLIRSLFKFDKINLDYKYPKVSVRGTVDDDDEDVIEEVLFDAIRQKNSSRVREIIKLDQIFLDHGNPEEENRTALHLAASMGSLEIVKILIEEGRASMGFMNKFGEFPRHVAARNGHYDIVNYMAELRENRGLLLDAVQQKNSSLVRSLIKSNKSLVGFRYKDESELGGTILHVAASFGHLEIVKILIEEGRADFSDGDDNDELPKELAARNGHVDVVHYLTKAGCTCDVDFYMEQAEQDRRAEQDKRAKQANDKQE